MKSNLKTESKDWPPNNSPYTDDAGTKRWYKDVDKSKEPHEWKMNMLHRKDGPAVIWPPCGNSLWSNGGEEWFMNDVLHRTDGPAIIYHTATHTHTEYWYRGERIRSAVDYEFLAELTEEDVLAMVLKYGEIT